MVNRPDIPPVVWDEAGRERELRALRESVPRYDPGPRELPECPPHLAQYLAYLENVGGDIAVDRFDDDWEPIGESVRAWLCLHKCAREDQGVIFIRWEYPKARGI